MHSVNILDSTLETIMNAKYAVFNPKSLPEIREYIANLQKIENYNPINLLSRLKKTNNYLQTVVKDRKKI